MKNFIKHIKMSTLECAEARKQLCVVKNLIFLGVTAILALCMFLLAGCERTEKDVREYIKINSEIEVPIDSEIVYHIYDDATFLTGRRAQYTVFKFENEPTNWLKENTFSEGRDENFEMYFMSSLAFLPVETEEIPDEFFPEFEKDYLWLETNSSVYFFYDIQNFMLIVSIAGH